MDDKELLRQTDYLLSKVERASSEARSVNSSRYAGLHAEVVEFFRRHAGTNSSFYKQADTASGFEVHFVGELFSLLVAYKENIEAGLHDSFSLKRQAEIDVVSDFLEMANALLQEKGVHPAAAAVLIGATLEEYLRTWIENESLSLNEGKPSLERYSAVLRAASLITKQDGKDITSWSGIRNHAAHGEWEEVADKKRIELMLEGVNLFMRKYGA